MRRVLVGFLVAASLAGCSNPLSILGGDPAGDWKVEGESTTFTITKYASDWGVKVSGGGSGKFDGSKLTFTTTYSTSDGFFQSDYEGTTGGGKITGTINTAFHGTLDIKPTSKAFTANKK